MRTRRTERAGETGKSLELGRRDGGKEIGMERGTTTSSRMSQEYTACRMFGRYPNHDSSTVWFPSALMFRKPSLTAYTPTPSK